MRGGWVEFLHDADDLGQLFHERALIMQAAGRINEKKVFALFRRAFDTVIGEARSISSVFSRDNGHIGALPPHLKLFDRRSTEGISRHEHDGFAFFTVMAGHFADGCGLADTVDADHEDDMGLLLRIRLKRDRNRLQNPRNFFGEGIADFVTGDVLAKAGAAKALDNALCHDRTQVCRDQFVFEFFESSIVQLAMREHSSEP